MPIYMVSKLDYAGRPDFSRSRKIEDTESKMLIKLSKEIDDGIAKGFYIYQENNRSGLKMRFLKKEGEYFVVTDKDRKPVQRFTLSKPKAAPRPKPSVARPKVSPNGPYSFFIESDEPYFRFKSFESRRFDTLQMTYAGAYRELKKHVGKPLSVTFLKDGDMMKMKVGRVMSYNPWYGCIVLSMYGKNSTDYRVYADGRLKKLTQADIKKR